MPTVTFNGTQQDLRRLFARLPRILAGHEADVGGIARGLQLRLGVALLSKIQQAFIVKSRGGTGSDGIKWPPLKRETIAGRRPPSHKKRGERPMGLLTAAQDKRWRKLFGAKKAMLMAKFGMGPGEASAKAAQFAWGMLKSEGAKTRIGTLGGRQVDTLRDTGELFRSFSPGVEDQPSGADGQIFRTPSGRVIVGSNKKPWHHRGVPGKLPARPFWPLDDRIPAAWMPDLIKTAKRGLVRMVALLMAQGKGAA